MHRIPPISAAAFIALLLASSATYQFVSDAADDNPDQFTIDPDLARLLNNAANSLNPEAAIPMLAPLVLATSLVALRTRVFPRWLGWAGFVVAFGCLCGFLAGLFALWVVVVSVYLARRPEIASG